MITCLRCGKTFKAARSDQKFCDLRCRTNAPLKCKNCGKIFKNSHSTRAYCSRLCYRESHVGNKVLCQGYMRIRVPIGTPGADKTNRMMEHRYVMQTFLKRALRADETVHHINGDKLDNRIENLELRSGRHGKGVKAKCLDCGSHNIDFQTITIS